MLEILVVAGIGGLIWGIQKLYEPWRRYHEQYIAPLEGDLKSAETRLSDKDRELQNVSADADLFNRDFRSEIERHQATKSAAYEQLKRLSEIKSQLHDDLASVRAKLDSWHRSSKSFFGNKGQKIKDDSFFGWIGLEQTVAQKENLERRRASLSRDIVVLKGRISDIYETQINPAKGGIKAAYDDKKRVDALRRAGWSKENFRAKVAKLAAERSEIEVEISRLKDAIDAVTEAYKRRGT